MKSARRLRLVERPEPPVAEPEQMRAAEVDWGEHELDLFPEMISVHDAEHRIIAVNKAMAKQLGLSKTEVRGKICYELLQGRSSPCLQCPTRQAAITGPAEAVLELAVAGGLRTVNFYPMADNSQVAGFIHMVRNSQPQQKQEKGGLVMAGVVTSLLQVASAMNSFMSEEEILASALRFICEQLPCRRSLIMLRRDPEQPFVAASQYGLNNDMLAVFLKISLSEGDYNGIDKVIQGRSSRFIDLDKTPSQLPGYFRSVFQIYRLQVVPVLVRDAGIGVMFIEHVEEKEFPTQAVMLAEGIANLMAMALENVRLYEESMGKSLDLARKIETISVMHDIDRYILACLEKDRLLDAVTANVQRIIPCDSLTVTLRDENRRGFVVAATSGDALAGLERGALVACDDFLPNRAVRTRRPFLSSDILQEKRHNLQKDLFACGSMRSLYAVPLITGDSVFGTINFAGRRVGFLTQEDLGNACKLAAQVALSLENARLFDELQGLFVSTVESLVSAIDAKSPWTKGHSERVKGYAVRIGNNLGLSHEAIEQLKLSAILHDVGKIGTYEAVLDKPGPLTDEEYAMMKTHPTKGAGILSKVKQFNGVIPGIKHHHERFDGKGYPDGLNGENIPLEARILCVADSYDAMTSDRPYRKGLSPGKAVEEMRSNAGKQFDPLVVGAFLQVLQAA